MKILKRGTPQAERVYQASCGSCGTKVEFKHSEGTVTYDQRDGDFIEVKCPVCRSRIITSTR
jgi:DNA-directed RNA polymerase subunit RPC12/RpoP